MTSRTILCCLEERSALELLNVLLPQLLPEGWRVQFITFEGKTDLRNRLGFRLRHWKGLNSAVLVMCDQDAQDCRRLKQELLMAVAAAGYSGASKVRIACHELENFYLGDLLAVEKGLGIKGLSKLSAKALYRQPDELTNAPEQLKKITSGRYRKCEGSRAIARHMDLTGTNRSQSFRALITAIKELTRGA